MKNLARKNANIQKIAEKVLAERTALSELVGNLTSRDETVRSNSARVLNIVSRENPVVVSPYWDDFVRLLKSDHLYWKLSVIPLLAALTRIDESGRFEKIFNPFFGLLDDRSFISAVYVAQNCGTIALAKPGLRTRILNRLLAIDRTRHVPERRDLIKGAAVEAFDAIFEACTGAEQSKMLKFADALLDSKSPKSRKAAGAFLKKRGLKRTA